MFPSGLTTSWETIALVVVSTCGVYLALVLFSRMAGLRSFSQMTNFDMAATIAFGSMVATTAISSDVSLLQGAIGLAVLFAIQAVVAQLRRRRVLETVVDSRPRLLMHGTHVLMHNLSRTQMNEDDLRAKLRLAGVTRYEQVFAVILESTGEVSVLTKPADDENIDPDLLSRVIGREFLTSEEEPRNWENNN